MRIKIEMIVENEFQLIEKLSDTGYYMNTLVRCKKFVCNLVYLSKSLEATYK